MLKFMKHQQKLTPERIQKQRELFAFSKACYHGFPSKPSALAWDPALRLIALATKGSVIRMYGQPGVEVYGQSDRCDAPITRITFLEGQGRLVSLCEDNSLHLWEMKEAKEEEEGGGGGRLRLVHIKSTSLEGKLKRISVVVGGGAGSGGQQLMVGTEGGNIYLLDLTSFTMSDNIIYQDVVMQNVPEDYKLNPGPVEAIAVHPKEATRILIGYQRGLVVLWDTKNLCADQTYVSSQQLESVCWHPDAAHFTTSHNDGSYVEWSAVDSSQPSDGPHTVYGPFPCKPITKILRPPANEGQQYIVFSGGMPRASYGDKNTVTVIEGERHVTFSLSSKVLDFVIVKNKDTGVGSSLVVLAEEEVVFIDLETEDWPAFQAPYLASLHSSAITCAYLAAGVLNEVMDKIKDAGRKQHARLSSRPWPVDGGRLPKEEEEEEGKKKKKEQDILLTGHEDGTVQFWDASSVSLQLLYKLSTSQLFVSEDLGGEGAAAEDDDWPPFRKAGLFDPYSDDPRLGVKKMQMCPYTGMLVVAGTAGQVLVMSPSSEAKELTPQATDVNLVADNDSFVWKSHSKLETRTEAVKLEAGMQPTAILQFFPPASCTSLALHSEWGLVACGTAHGFALFDTAQNKNLLARSTLSPLDLASTADEGPMSRRKSLKKSLRESFRRLRRGRSQRKTGGGGRAGATSPPATSPPPSSRGGGGADDEAVKPVERAIEARSSAPDYVGSMVRCLHLTKCFIANNQAMSATLWAGTNSGSIFVFTIAIPPSDKRQEVPLTVQLGKEIHLKHGAPVLGVWVLDGCGQPFPPPMAVKKDVASPPSTTLPHRVLICSEEQFKVFTLPQLKPFCKFKLTAHEGSRARKLDLGEFVSTADSSYSETCLVLATNQGDFSIFSLPDCRRQLYAPYIKKEDISGINSVVFTRRGEALYLASPSELERVSLSARHVTRPRGTVPDVKAVAPLTAKKEGQGQEKGGDTTTATTTTTPPPTTTTTTTTTTTNAAAAAAESAETTTLQLKEQNGEKEETGGKAGGGGGADAAGGGGGGGGEGGGGGRKEEVRENGDNSVLSGDITIDSIRDHMDEVKVAQKVEELCGAVTTTTTTTAAAMSESVAVLKAAAITDTTTTTAATATTTTTSSSAISSSQESPSIQLVETTTTITSSSTFSISSSSSTNTTTTTTTVAAAADSATLSIVNGTE